MLCAMSMMYWEHNELGNEGWFSDVSMCGFLLYIFFFSGTIAPTLFYLSLPPYISVCQFVVCASVDSGPRIKSACL